MKELVEVIAKSLVDFPDEVVVTESENEKGTLLELRVAQSDMGKKDKIDYLELTYLPTIHHEKFVKVRHYANPYDPSDKSYYEWRETYRMKQTLKGRQSLINIWKRQNKVCPVCGERIDRERPWSITEQIVSGRKVRTLVHTSCKRKMQSRL